jgi:hypothetical protein
MLFVHFEHRAHRCTNEKVDALEMKQSMQVNASLSLHRPAQSASTCTKMHRVIPERALRPNGIESVTMCANRELEMKSATVLSGRGGKERGSEMSLHSFVHTQAVIYQ